MTDTLKAAVREALVEGFGYDHNVTESRLDVFTSALARRGVVVVGEGQSAELIRLYAIEVAARNVADTLNGGFIRCERCGEQETTTDIDYARELYAALQLPQASPTPPESPAPKPARKVISRQYLGISEGWVSFCDDDTSWRATVDGWELFRKFAPIPQPGDDQ
jgi:hypothetical protein